MKQTRKDKELKGNLLWVILFSVIAVSSLLLVNNYFITGFSVKTDRLIMGEVITEKTTEIEVFADTDLTLQVVDDNISAILKFDNGGVLSEQEIKFYLDDLFMGDEITNSEGYAKITIDLSDLEGKNYILSVEFLGDPSLLLNPSSKDLEFN